MSINAPYGINDAKQGKMIKGIVLHTVEDARHCVKNNLHQGSLLFSTHSSVDVYLQELHGISCQCLSVFFTHDELFIIKNETTQSVDRLLSALDKLFAPLLNRTFGLSMQYFTPLYGYLGKYHYSGYRFFVAAVHKIMKIHSLDKIFFYNCEFNTYFNTRTDMATICSLFFNSYKTEVLHYPHSAPAPRLMGILKRMLTQPVQTLARLAWPYRAHIKYRLSSRPKKNLLLFENLYNLHFLRTRLSRYNVIYYFAHGSMPVGMPFSRQIGDHEKAKLPDLSLPGNSADPLESLFMNDVIDDFTRSIHGYVNSIAVLRNIIDKHPLSLGIWGSPPTEKTRAFIFEYLRSNRIPVLGAQHGCTYGDSIHPWLIDSDFNKCNYFISYGFTQEDLQRVYPKQTINARIVPCGKITDNKASIFSKKIDLLFPLTNSMSIFSSGMTRIPPHELTHRQIQLLEYLNSLVGYSIYVKPFPYSTYDNCSVLPILKRFKNLKVIYDMYLTEFLAKFSPASVLIEYPSQPLFEVLHLDTEIFLMNNYMIPYEELALKELKNRVYYSENVNETISSIDLFFKRKLLKKRDNTFFRHYVHKENPEEAILKIIGDLVGSHA